MDEPTNHLDLEACVWLEEELKTYKNILVLISHSQVTSGHSKSVGIWALSFLLAMHSDLVLLPHNTCAG